MLANMMKTMLMILAITFFYQISAYVPDFY